MLLSKIPVLDNGYVALLETSLSDNSILKIGEEYCQGQSPHHLRNLSTATLLIKCPLFVQLTLSKFNLKMQTINSFTIEAYKPDATEIGCPERLDSAAISDDISRTTDALLINPKAYQADGANYFISQVITPINVYTTLIIQGSYNDWRRFISQEENIPQPILAYINAIKQIIEAEWR